ncbi:MAG: hypothetical protein CL676_05270 [Bdellovibrionaceae bacterium]|nr:hypothetical protein [Pseudobdellovibrionaceae bacterium]
MSSKNLSPTILVHDRFYPQVSELRDFFDQQFENPLEVHENRFVWDFWNVPGHYCHLRTPAYNYFPPEIYDPFHEYLVNWGRENLGCHDISPTWLSCYPEGSFQNIHRDAPHGPFAFVFSLTKSSSKFKGGRTVVGQKKVTRSMPLEKLELKKSVSELKDFTSVPPKFNRLVVFDPSYPHGVSETNGSKDPRESRLVVHGWFVQPRPFWEGPLNEDQVQEVLDSFLWKLSSAKEFKNVEGYVGFRIFIGKDGKVEKIKTLVSTLNSVDAQKWLLKASKDLKFSAHKEGSVLTLPLMFS